MRENQNILLTEYGIPLWKIEVLTGKCGEILLRTILKCLKRILYGVYLKKEFCMNITG